MVRSQIRVAEEHGFEFVAHKQRKMVSSKLNTILVGQEINLLSGARLEQVQPARISICREVTSAICVADPRSIVLSEKLINRAVKSS